MKDPVIQRIEKLERRIMILGIAIIIYDFLKHKLRLYLVLPFLLVCGCAVPSTRFTYRELNGTIVEVELSKELEAKDLKVKIDAKNGTAIISAKEISTKNVESIKAQGIRESKNLGKVSDLAGDITEGAVKGAMKGVVP